MSSKSLMEDAKSPFGKWQWNVYLHFAASNRASRRNHRRRQTLSKSDGAADRKKTTRPPKDEVKNNSSIAGAEIKRLRLENKLLTKLANKFLDEYIKLKTRNGELSENYRNYKAFEKVCVKKCPNNPKSTVLRSTN